MPQGANVVVQTQKIVVNPTTRSVAVINAGPQGPPGPPGSAGPPGPGTPNEYVKADGSVPMTGLLTGVGVWEAVQSRFGDGSSVQPVFLMGKAGSGYLAFFPNITDMTTQGTRSGYVGFVGDNLRLASELAGSVVQIIAAGVPGPSFDASSMVFPSTHNINFGAAVRQMLNLYGTSYGIGVQSSTLYFRHSASSAAAFSWYDGGIHSDTKGDAGAGGTEVMRMEGGLAGVKTLSIPGRAGSNFLLGDSVSAGPRLRMHLPASGEFAYIDFEGTTVNGGDLMFRSGATGILQLENTVIRPLKSFYTNFPMRFPYGSHIFSTDGLNCYFGLYKDGTTADAMGTRAGYMGFVNNEIVINNETGTNLKILSGTSGVVVLGVGSTEKVRIDTGGVINCGRTANSAYYTDSGVDMRPTGQFLSTCDTVNSFPWLVRISAALAAGQRFLSFRTATSGSGAEIGSISMATTTSTAYNTTSHGPFKGNVEDLDDDEAIARIEKWRPVAFQWKLDEEGQLDEEGTPQGEVQHGFIAQEMNEINPSAVTPGYGTWEEHLVWREKQQAYSTALSKYMRIEAEITAINDENNAVLQPWQEACQHLQAESAQTKKPLALPRRPSIKKVPVLPELPEKPDELSPFSSWQADWTMLVPDLSAAVQALIRQNRALTERIDELERSSR